MYECFYIYLNYSTLAGEHVVHRPAKHQHSNVRDVKSAECIGLSVELWKRGDAFVKRLFRKRRHIFQIVVTIRSLFNKLVDLQATRVQWAYLRSKISFRVTRRSLRSSANDRRVDEPILVLGHFAAFPPTIWNTLPYDIRGSSLVSVLKSKLKAHYFRLASR